MKHRVNTWLENKNTCKILYANLQNRWFLKALRSVSSQKNSQSNNKATGASTTHRRQSTQAENSYR